MKKISIVILLALNSLVQFNLQLNAKNIQLHKVDKLEIATENQEEQEEQLTPEIETEITELYTEMKVLSIEKIKLSCTIDVVQMNLDNYSHHQEKEANDDISSFIFPLQTQEEIKQKQIKNKQKLLQNILNV